MLFNSYIFLLFFIIVYGGYLLLSGRVRPQNILLLIASYVFYGWWDWRFCGLLLLSTVVDYCIGLAMSKSEDDNHRKRLLAISVVVNLGVLAFFKYFGFFYESVAAGLQELGMDPPDLALRVLLPVGISFYTFQTMSYTIDLYRRKLDVCKDPTAFALYVAFFPQLVAGPIERAKHLLPQILSPRHVTWNLVDHGLWLVLWGYFKKVVIADNLAGISNAVFDDPAANGGLNIIIGALAFTGQIYCDFSGYTDIARGIAKMMGFDFMLNFRLPYFALNPSDFWRRWHISLSSWLRDYLYIPLGGNRGGRWATYRNLSLTMLLGGLWHGAAWNFVIWGAFHGALLIAYRPFTSEGSATPRMAGLGWLKVLTQWAIMSVFTVIGWIIFRANSASDIVEMLTNVGITTTDQTREMAWELLFFWSPLVVMQLIQHRTRNLTWPLALPWILRGALYAWLLGMIIIFAVREPIEFIYFQF